MSGQARPAITVDAELWDNLTRMVSDAEEAVKWASLKGGTDTDEWIDAMSSLRGDLDAHDTITRHLAAAERRTE